MEEDFQILPFRCSCAGKSSQKSISVKGRRPQSVQASSDGRLSSGYKAAFYVIPCCYELIYRDEWKYDSADCFLGIRSIVGNGDWICMFYDEHVI